MSEIFITRLPIQPASFEIHEVGDLVETGDTISLRQPPVFYGEDRLGDKLFGMGIVKKINSENKKAVIVFNACEDVTLPNGLNFPPKDEGT